MKSETTLREYPVHSHLPSETISRAYEEGANDMMSALADEFGLVTNGYAGAHGRECLVEHIRAKLNSPAPDAA